MYKNKGNREVKHHSSIVAHAHGLESNEVTRKKRGAARNHETENQHSVRSEHRGESTRSDSSYKKSKVSRQFSSNRTSDSRLKQSGSSYRERSYSPHRTSHFHYKSQSQSTSTRYSESRGNASRYPASHDVDSRHVERSLKRKREDSLPSRKSNHDDSYSRHHTSSHARNILDSSRKPWESRSKIISPNASRLQLHSVNARNNKADNISRTNNFRTSFSKKQKLNLREQCLQQQTLIEKLRKSAKWINIYSYNKYISLLNKCGKYQEAEDLFDAIRAQADMFTHSTMLRVYANQQKYKEAEELYEAIRAQADIVTHSTMLSVYTNQQKYQEAEELYEAIRAEADIITHNTMLRVYANQQKYQEAEELYESIRAEATIVTHNTMLTIYVNQQKYQEAEELYESIRAEATIVTHSTMLTVYANQQKYKEAEGLYEAIRTEATIVTHSTMLTVYANQQKYQEAEDLFDAIRAEADIVTHSTMLTVYANQQKYKEAEELYEAIRDQATIVTHCTMLTIYANQKKYKKAEELYEAIRAQADIVTHSMMLSVYARQQKHKEAEELYEAIRTQATIVTHNTMLTVYANQQKYQEAEELYEAIRAQADIFTHSTMLSVYVNQQKYQEAEDLFDAIRAQADIVTHNTMLTVYANQQKYQEAEDLFDTIRAQADIVTHNTMLSVYANQQKYTEAESLYEVIRAQADIVTHSTMLSVYANQQKYTEAESLYEVIRAQADIVTHSTMLSVYTKQEKYTETEALYQQIKKNADVVTLLVFTRFILKQDKINCSHFEIFKKLGEHAKMPGNASRLGKAVCRYHQLINWLDTKRYKRNNTFSTEIAEAKKEQWALLEALDNYASSNPEILTLQEAWLLNTYFPDKEYAPKHDKMSDKTIREIQRGAYNNATGELKPLSQTELLKIHVINQKGQKIAEYALNHSMLHTLSNGAIEPYVIVKFDRPIKASRIPLYIRYQGKVYQTDILGGSKLKTKFCDNEFGARIAVPIESSGFFKTLIPYEEGYYYGQRAFLPEEQNLNNKGLTGTFKVTAVPDAEHFSVFSNLIVKDGCGYIKKSVADTMQLKLTETTTISSTNLTYQALQSYSTTSSSGSAVQELVEKGRPVIAAYKEESARKTFSEKLYHALIGGLEALVGTALPVRGNKITLARQRQWEELTEEGCIVGRDPYDSQKLQVLEKEQIEYSSDFSDLKAIQYSLTGYTLSKEENAVGRFFKGLLVIIDDKNWPKEYSESQILVSSKDQKLCQTWVNEQDKKATQDAKEHCEYELTGALVVKKVIPSPKLIGIPEPIAIKSAGDYDGDHYSVISGHKLTALKKALQEESQILNPKITKTFTPRMKAGNLRQIHTLNLGLLERWTGVYNMVCFLSPQDRKKLAETLFESHILFELGKEDWQQRFNIAEHEQEKILLCEIQLGLKYGQDAAKTHVPETLLKRRVVEYERELRKLLGVGFTVPYAKSFKKKLKSTFENEGRKEVAKLILNRYSTYKEAYQSCGYNLVAATQMKTMAFMR